MGFIIFVLICILCMLSIRYMMLRSENYEQFKTINQLQEALNKRFTDSFADPQLRQMRIMLPDEIEDIKNRALLEYHNNPGGTHSDCHRTLLIVLYTLYSGSSKG